MSCEKIVKHYISVDLTGENIESLIGKPPVKYSDLKKYKNVKELLGKHGYAVILWQTDNEDTGHWVALYERFDGVLTYADSYGLHWGQERRYAPYDAAEPHYLSKLIESSGMKTDWLKTDYQRKGSGIDTCGRWSCFFSLFGKRMTFPEINRFLTSNQSSFLTPDAIVTITTLWDLNEIRHFFDRENK